MGLLLAIVVVALLVGGAAAAWIFLRRSGPAAAPEVQVVPAEDPAAQEARHRIIDQRGSELLERRSDLDARRGTLTGDSEAFEAFDHLEARFHAGEISEEEFEAGKIRILGGQT